MCVKEQRSRVPTPVPTPSLSATPSVSEQHVSLPSTPELSQASDHIDVRPTQPLLPSAEAVESITDDAADDFPSYNGQSMVCGRDLVPRAGYGNCTIGPIHFLARWRKKAPKRGSVA